MQGLVDSLLIIRVRLFTQGSSMEISSLGVDSQNHMALRNLKPITLFVQSKLLGWISTHLWWILQQAKKASFFFLIGKKIANSKGRFAEARLMR